jgi:hypothetical protein
MHPEEVIAALRFEPLLPLWLIATLSVMALLTVALAALRRARGTLWRIAGFAVLLLWLAGPRVVQESRDNLPDIGLLVVDQSASMQVGERARRRAGACGTHPGGKLPDLGNSIRDRAGERRCGTRLFSAIDRALADIPVRGWPARLPCRRTGARHSRRRARRRSHCDRRGRRPTGACA